MLSPGTRHEQECLGHRSFGYAILGVSIQTHHPPAATATKARRRRSFPGSDLEIDDRREVGVAGNWRCRSWFSCPKPCRSQLSIAATRRFGRADDLQTITAGLRKPTRRGAKMLIWEVCVRAKRLVRIWTSSFFTKSKLRPNSSRSSGRICWILAAGLSIMSSLESVWHATTRCNLAGRRDPLPHLSYRQTMLSGQPIS